MELQSSYWINMRIENGISDNNYFISKININVKFENGKWRVIIKPSKSLKRHIYSYVEWNHFLLAQIWGRYKFTRAESEPDSRLEVNMVKAKLDRAVLP